MEKGKNYFINKSKKLYKRFRIAKNSSLRGEKYCKENVDGEEKKCTELKKLDEENKPMVDKKNNKSVHDKQRKKLNMTITNANGFIKVRDQRR